MAHVVCSRGVFTWCVHVTCLRGVVTWCVRLTLNDSTGMREAFTDRADFSRIAESRLLISSVTHQSYIKVHEKGTEAAAATAIGVVGTSFDPTQPKVPKPYPPPHALCIPCFRYEGGLRARG